MASYNDCSGESNSGLYGYGETQGANIAIPWNEMVEQMVEAAVERRTTALDDVGWPKTGALRWDKKVVTTKGDK
jgi:hypothetical protein